MLLATDDELILVLEDLTDEDDWTDWVTELWMFSDKLVDAVADTLFWTLSEALFSALCTKLDWTFPSTLFSTLSARLFCDLLALSLIPVAVFSTLDYKKNILKIYLIDNGIKTHLSWAFWSSVRSSGDTGVIHFNEIHFLWIIFLLL